MINFLFFLLACISENALKDSAGENTNSVEEKYLYGNYPAKDCTEYNNSVYELSQNEYIEQPIAQVEVQRIIPKFELMDEWGQIVTNYDFCHMAILVVVSAAWSEPAQFYRAEAQRLHYLYADKGLVVINLLVENEGGQQPSAKSLADWRMGLDYIVLSDPNWEVTNQGYASGGIPAISLIAPGYVAIIVNGYPTDADIESMLPLVYE